MRVGFVFPHLSHGSPGSFQRTYLMCKALVECGVKVVILTPFEEDKEIMHDVETAVLPSVFTRLHLSSLMYKAARRFSSSPLTSRLFLSQTNIRQIAGSIQRGME